MLMSESLEIGEMFRAAMRDALRRSGAGRLAFARSIRFAARPRSAGRGHALLDEQPLDLMIVVGGLQQQQHL
jgi:hypothetical protein